MRTVSGSKRPAANDPLVICAPDPTIHRDSMYDLIAKVFSHSGYFTFRAYLKDGYVGHSHYDWAASRIGLLDGAIVSHYGVWDYQTRIGRGAQLRTGGIGVVATDGGYRKRGFMEQTAAASVAAMRELGYDISILFGIENFYHRFGYTRAWAEVRYSLSADDLPKDRPRGVVMDLPATPGPRLARLHNKCFADVTGTAVRPTYSALHYPGRRDLACRGWGPRAGSPAGYVYYWIDRQTLMCVEACGDAEQALRVVGQAAREAHCPHVAFDALPETSDLARRLRRGNVERHLRYRRCGSAMICTISLASALQKMAGELSRRLADSPLANWKGSLQVSDRRDRVRLEIDGGVSVCRDRGRAAHRIEGGDAIASLLIGTDEPLETAAACGIKLHGQAARLLAVLFPAQHPMLHEADRY
jgi:predicted N-acetyltransferase YhbS